MKILVTGANGYIGQGVVKALIDMGQTVIATDLSLKNVVDDAIKKEADIFTLENPYAFFEEPDILIHLAWRDGFKHYASSHLEDLPRHYSFVEKFVESKVSKICIMGSMHEIGFFEGSIDENTSCNPLSLYGVAKNALRQAVQQLARTENIPLIWLRGYYIVGNTKYGCSIFSKITEAVEKGKKEFPFTSGQNQFDFIDYEYFCKQIACTSLQNEVLGIVECCTGKPEKLADRVERFIEENNYNIKLAYGTFPDRPYDSKAVWGNDSKIAKIMNAYKEKSESNECD